MSMVVLPDASAASSETVNSFTRAESQSTAAHTWESRVLALAMAAHSRLGIHSAQSVCDVARSPDLLLQIMRQAVLVVPDDVSTLVAALHRAAPWQQVLLRRGEYNVDGRVGGGPGSSQLRVSRPVEICGEPGAVLRGTLVLDKHCLGGAVRNLRIDDGGDCCIRCEGGSWELTGVRLRCSHGSALLVTGSSRVVLSECVLGGEDDEEAGQHVMLSAYGSLQETGLHKRACFALVAKDEARIVAKLCSLRQCSEAAVLIAHASLVFLEACDLSHCTAAFLAGEGFGHSLRLDGCTLMKTALKIWADADRPRAFEWGASEYEEVREEHEGEESGYADIVRPAQPRGAHDDDSSDTDSLEDSTAFANMEALMEELDNAALSAAAAS